jgi:hypothetical protein
MYKKQALKSPASNFKSFAEIPAVVTLKIYTSDPFNLTKEIICKAIEAKIS